jgi:DNA (cytosine-5)-methyltransferase 1
MKIKVLDLFSGIGGFHLGLERAGFEVESYFSEIDKYAIDVYSNNFKNATYVGSVTDVRSEQLPRINAITFGSPCQDFSLAGKRKGLDGERSSLITEAIRLIEECRPSFFIWENVKGTFSSNNREDFAAILQAFTNIGGYRLEWQLLNTKWFLPQNRERIYLVGYLGGGSGGQVFPIGENDQPFNRTIGTEERESERMQTSHSRTIKRNIGNMGSDDTYIKVKSATSKGYEEANEGDSINLSVPTSKTRRGRVGKGVAQTLDTKCDQAVIGYTRDAKGNVTNRSLKDECNTLHSSSGQGGNTDQFIKQGRIRRLTPIECERLQGFPDNWTKYGKEKEISDSQRYKMCGNAVTVDVVAEVAKRIKTIIKDKNDIR